MTAFLRARSDMSHTPLTAGARLRSALEAERPLQLVGTINAYAALLAQRAGFRAIYLSGAGVANASFGLPDLGITSLNDVCEDVRRITGASALPLLVDADTGWGGAFNIARTTRELIRAGAAGMHLEDQVSAKRCGHRPGKALVASAEMCDRIKAAVDARTDPPFVIMARTDAHAVEGQAAALERAQAYVAAGADMIFAEALRTLDEYRQFVARSEGAGAREPHRVRRDAALHACSELAATGVRLALYPLSAFAREPRARRRRSTRPSAARARSRASCRSMQTRAELYDVLGYHDYEKKLDDCSDPHMTDNPDFKPKKSVALSGVTAGNTALCTVGRTGNDLHYRGYDILEIAQVCEFEEIAHLLIHEKLPTRAELAAYKTQAARAARPARARCARCSRRCPPPAIRWMCCAPGSRRMGCALPEKDDASAGRRARHRRPADRLLRLDARVLVPLQPLGRAHRGGDRR